MIEIRSIGIVGAGTMGQGIAQLCATYGREIILYDISDSIVNEGLEKIKSSLQTAIDKGKLTTEQRSESLSRINLTTDLAQVKADLIIEAAIEKLEVKKEIFGQLELSNSPKTILTTNTSSIPVTQIASVLKHPERFAGLHFFNPAQIMKLVEIISGAATDSNTIDTLKEFAKSIKKVAVVANDSPGFIVNRVARHFYVESLKAVEEDVADIRTVDSLMKSTGFRMGPFELMDLIGVDTNFSVTQSMYESFHYDGKFRPSRLQQQKVDAGHHGKKSGKGFYDYT